MMVALIPYGRRTSQNYHNKIKVVFPDVTKRRLIFSMWTYVEFQNIMDISVTFGHLYKYGKDLTFSNSVCSIPGSGLSRLPGAIIWKQRRHRIIHSSAHIIIQCIMYRYNRSNVPYTSICASLYSIYNIIHISSVQVSSATSMR